LVFQNTFSSERKKQTIRRKELVILSTLIATIVLVIVLVFPPKNVQSPVDEVPAYEAKITAFTADTSWAPIAGLTLAMYFNVTVQNIGKNDINFANVTVQRIVNGTDTLVDWVYLGNNTISFQPNETKLVRAVLLTSINYYNEVAASHFISRVSLNGTVLDERILH
jgi:hypothetical protein